MLPPKSLIAGVALLLLGITGFIYNGNRPRPPLLALQPEALPIPAPSAIPETPPTIPFNLKPPTIRPKTIFVPKLAAAQRTQLLDSSTVVKLISPTMAETFTAPATVSLKAVARPAGDDLAKVEFYYEPTEWRGRSICRSLSKLNNLGRLNKIGEVITAPYNFTWKNLSEGTYSVMAIASYKTGVQQLSPPVVIVVNAADTYEGSKWQGWRPPYLPQELAGQDTSLLRAPIPSPSCPAITVSSKGSSPTTYKELISFTATMAGGEPSTPLTYDWKVSAGIIKTGQGTATITVLTTSVVDKELTASVEIKGLPSICPNTGSASITIHQPRWLDASARLLLIHTKHSLNKFVASMEAEHGAKGYIVAYSKRGNCIDAETVRQIRLIKKYLTNKIGIDDNRIILINGGPTGYDSTSTGLDWDLHVISPGGSLPSFALMAERALPFVACRHRVVSSRPTKHIQTEPTNRKCPDVEEEINYGTAITTLPDDSTPPANEDNAVVNVCPYNPRDPQNSSNTQFALTPYVLSGNYGEFPLFSFWTNGGKIIGTGQERIWDLSGVKLHPGVYTAVAISDDECDCSSVNTTQVRVTNFCTPCLTLGRVCEPESPEDGKQTFTAKVPDFTTVMATTYHWATSHGTIINGQGTPTITVDTSMLHFGTVFTVTVRVGGLQRYCVNKLTYKSVAGMPCRILLQSLVNDAAILTGPGPRPAKRRSRQEEQAPASQETRTSETTSGQTTGISNGGDQAHRAAAEKEWIKIEWAPRVEVQRSFAVIVQYNRTAEKVDAFERPGESVAPLNIRSHLNLLKEKYGPDYQVWAVVRLHSAGLECDGCVEEKYQSLDNEEVEWSWSVTPKRSGTQTFNLELWVKGVPRQNSISNTEKSEEKVWSRNNLEVQVSEPLLTRNTILASSILFTFVGVGFSIRGIHIYSVGDTYNVGQAVAVGRNVRMENTTVNQNRGSVNVEQHEQEDDNGETG